MMFCSALSVQRIPCGMTALVLHTRNLYCLRSVADYEFLVPHTPCLTVVLNGGITRNCSTEG